MQQTIEELELALIEKPASDEGNKEGSTKSRPPTSPHNISAPTRIPTLNSKGVEEGLQIQLFRSIKSIS